jgi:hypothetical protein
MGNAINLNPETFIEGSGLLDDCDATVVGASFEMFDYNGKAKEAAPCLKLALDVAGDVAEQYYSMGSAQDWIPSEDGNQLLKVGSANSIRLSSNGGIFISNLVSVGFPADKLGEEIGVLVGLQAHFIQTPLPERKGLKKNADQVAREEKYGPPTILVVSDILVLTWEKAKPAGGKAAAKPAGGKAKPAAAKPAAKAAAPEAGGIEEKATEIVMGILAEGESLTKKELTPKIFKVMADDSDRNKVIQLTFKDEFLASGPWAYADGVLSLG